MRDCGNRLKSTWLLICSSWCAHRVCYVVNECNWYLNTRCVPYSLIFKLEDSKDQKIQTVYVTTNIFALKQKKWIEVIFCLRQHLSLSHYVKFQSGHTQFSKLCLPKLVVLYKKLNFGDFESSNIRNENQQMNKSHFLSCTTYFSINLRKI